MHARMYVYVRTLTFVNMHGLLRNLSNLLKVTIKCLLLKMVQKYLCSFYRDIQNCSNTLQFMDNKYVHFNVVNLLIVSKRMNLAYIIFVFCSIFAIENAACSNYGYIREN